MRGHGRPDRAALTLDVRGEVSCPVTATLRASVLPLWLELARPCCLRLEWPSTDQPALRLHVYVRGGDHEIPDVERLAVPGLDVRVLPAGDDDDGPRELCLREATDILLSALQSNPNDRFEHAQRWQIVLTLVASGVQRLLKTDDRRRAYLAYHRDWLIRYPILRRGLGRAKAEELLRVLDTQRQQLGPLTCSQIAAQQDCVSTPAMRRWHRALKELSPCADQTDPFTSDPLFPALLRLHHALARLFGLALLDEASIYHALLAGSVGVARFCLAPHADRFPEPASGVSTSPITSIDAEYPWRQLIARTSPDAAQWMLQYRALDRIVGPWLIEALTLLRTGQLEAGACLLHRVADFRDRLRPADCSFCNVLGKFYFSELAYYRYAQAQYEDADREMLEAAECLRQAMDTHRFLMSMAPLLIDIPMQRARIARRRSDWPDVEAHLDQLYRMESGAVPLCVLSDGTRIDYVSIAAFLGEEALAALPEAKARIGDVEARLAACWRAIARLYALAPITISTPLE